MKLETKNSNALACPVDTLVKLWMLAKIKFSKNAKKEEISYPKPSSQWKLRNETPWPRENDPVVTVLDAKSKWVKYRIGNSKIFNHDHELPLELFLHCYREI